MAPSFVTIDTSDDDFNPTFFSPAAQQQQQNGHSNGNGSGSSKRTLLLAPPSIASHEQALRGVFATVDRATADLHMLDRLSAGLVALPPAAYDLVLVLVSAADGSQQASRTPLGRDMFARLVPAMRPGGRLANQDGSPVADAREAVLAGLVADGSGAFTRPGYEEEAAVPLRFGNKKKVNNSAVGATNNGQPTTNGSGGAHAAFPSAAPAVAAPPAGVGFVDLDDLGDYESGDELLDEDDILTEEDRNRPIQKRKY